MSIKKRGVSLAGAIYHGSGEFHVLVNAPGAENRETILAYGKRNEDQIDLIPLAAEEEFVSLIKISSGADDANPRCVGLTNEGEVIFVSGRDIRREMIPYAAYHNDQSRQLGYMTTIAQVGSGFVATGHGGQVYSRTSEGWQILDDYQCGQDRVPSLYSAIEIADGRIAFAGTEISDLDGNKDIEQANAESDAARLAELILASLEPDEAIVRIYDGNWQTQRLPESGALSPILRWKDRWIIPSDNGNIWQTNDFEAFDLLWAPDVPGRFQDVKKFEENVLLLRQDSLSVLTESGFVEFAPAHPAPDRTYLSLSADRHELILVENLRIALFDGTSWVALTPVISETDE